MHSPFLAMIAPVPAVIMAITFGLVLFCAAKIRTTMRTAAAQQRERELAMMASLPGGPGIVVAPGLAPAVVLPPEVPTLDALVLPSEEAPPDSGAAVVPVSPSLLVLSAVEELRAGAQRILDAGASGGDAAAADVMIAISTGPAVTALALSADPVSE